MIYTTVTVSMVGTVCQGQANRGKKAMINSAKNRTNRVISAKDIIKAYHISYQTVNHYTDFGLLPVSGKSGNVRFYDKSLVAKRLKEIKDLTSEGYSLRLVRKKLIGI